MNQSADAPSELGAEDPMLRRLVLGRYRVIDALAQGGMGVVYLGRTEGALGFSRPVVIKRVLPALLSDPSIGQMFIREARILANLRHPGIVGVVDFGEEDHAYIMVLEYVHGFDAAQWLAFLRRRGRQVPLDAALRIAIQVLEALHYAHNLRRPDGTLTQVVHRDISPGNILLDSDGHVRLSDFGIARIDDEAAEYRTQETTFKGKFGYAHPSLLAKGEPTPQTDVYSVGVVLFQLLTGINPFRGESAVETVHRVVNLPTPRLTEHWEQAPSDLEQVLVRALSKDPGEAFQDAQTFADALRKQLTRTEADVAADMAQLLTRDFQDLPSALGRRSLEDRDEAWRRSIPGPAPTALTSTRPGHPDEQATVPGGASTNDLTVVGDREEPPTTPTAGGKSQWLVIAAVVVSVLSLIGVATLFLAQKTPPAPGARYVVVSKDPSLPEASDEPLATALPHATAGSSPASRDTGAASEATPNHSRLPVPAEPGASVRRKPEPAYFTQVFSRRQGAVQQCFADSPQAEAVNLQILFEVDAQGKVVSASLAPSSLGGTALGQCVLRIARSVSFGLLTEGAAFRIPIQAKKQ
jgi:serine/threonine-protein kinase